MFEPENFQPSWSDSDIISSYLDEPADYNFAMDTDMVHSEFSSIFTGSEDSSDTSNMFADECVGFQGHGNDLTFTLPDDDFSIDLDGLDSILTDDIIEISDTLEEINGGSFSLPQSPIDMPLIQQPSLILPKQDMEIDNQLSIVHLVMAYGEAMENQQPELAEVIVKRLSEKVCPVGETMERLLYYLFQPLDKQSDYLKQESYRNFHAAFKAFYQVFPYGKFAHFAANSAILESMPPNAEILHIFDFDQADGVQWAPLIEAIGRQGRELRLTSIKWSEWGNSRSQWTFEETATRLLDHARSFGVKFTVDEMELHEATEIKTRNARDGRRKWFAFNLMLGLPHMGRVRSRKDVTEFLRVANEVLLPKTSNVHGIDPKGVLTFGDGYSWGRFKSSSSYSSFMDENLVHYQALLESMECEFPIHLGEARTTMECLFVSPFVSSQAWNQKWQEREECSTLQAMGLGLGLDACKLSQDCLIEAKEMVREGESLYGVRFEGGNNNGMVLEWRRVPLVSVSCWRS